eukprot:scaffold401139_cov28-Prasinocladus_malaysianus.AAC.1
MTAWLDGVTRPVTLAPIDRSTGSELATSGKQFSDGTTKCRQPPTERVHAAGLPVESETQLAALMTFGRTNSQSHPVVAVEMM